MVRHLFRGEVDFYHLAFHQRRQAGSGEDVIKFSGRVGTSEAGRGQANVPCLLDYSSNAKPEILADRAQLDPALERGCVVLDQSQAFRPDSSAWTTEVGKAAWYMYDLATGKILEQPEEIVGFIRSTPETPRRIVLPQVELHDVRVRVEKCIKNTYLKQVQAPVGVKPVLNAGWN